MLEWMQDDEVVQFLKADFASKTISDCENFVSRASNKSNNFHLAIVDDQDAYMGTVSLKNIENGKAEFAITMRKAAMGTGYAVEAMKEMIRRGFDEIGLNSIYWCVAPENQRAIRFYDKNGYNQCDFGELDIPGGGIARQKFRTIFGIEWCQNLIKYRFVSGYGKGLETI